VAVEAGGERGLPVLVAPVPGEREEDGVAEPRILAREPGHLVAVHAGEADVAEDHVRPEAQSRLDARRTRQGNLRFVPEQRQQVAERLGGVKVVFDDQDFQIASSDSADSAFTRRRISWKEFTAYSRCPFWMTGGKC
jgi:hypothetical protein